jgi:hypothetical protein
MQGTKRWGKVKGEIQLTVVSRSLLSVVYLAENIVLKAPKGAEKCHIEPLALSFGVSLRSLTSRSVRREILKKDLSGLAAVRDDNVKDAVRGDNRSILISKYITAGE